MLTRRLELGEPTNDPVTTWLALSAFAALGVAMVAYLVLFAGTGPDRSPLVGTWLGEGSEGGEVVYQFDAGGWGYRIAGGVREEFRYTLIEGYPNELRLRVDPDRDTAVYRGLVEFRGDRYIRLEMGGRGEGPPHRVTPRALYLTRPPSR
jgi:hypothetical protein